jgi:CNT family concentrative nucleoside transporter
MNPEGTGPQPDPNWTAIIAGGPAPVRIVPPTPWSWRFAILAAVLIFGGLAYLLHFVVGPRGQALAGAFCFFGIVALFSSNLRAVNWRTIIWGIGIQLVLAVLVLMVPPVERGFERAGDVVRMFIGFSDKGAGFVFGNLADARPPDAGGTWSRLFGVDYVFQFAFVALPPILFVSAFFTLLYHFGILQRLVRLLAWGMVYLMRTSGAETLSVSANVFMGMTEAPLIVRPYVPRMTNSELFALMVSGFAHISGGMMVVYINYGADPVSVLTTCVMACPCSLYLAKLFLPETSAPETAGRLHESHERSPYVNAVDAVASGTTDGLRLALNVAAMLIVFIAFVAMADAILGAIWPGLSLGTLFGWLFTPVAFLIGVEPRDVESVGRLLGLKLAINEHVAYLTMKDWIRQPDFMTARSYRLAAFALTGFANFGSVGIQLGGIGAMAPDRRHDLARLGGRALFVGFVATLLNASIAGVLLPAAGE